MSERNPNGTFVRMYTPNHRCTNHPERRAIAKNLCQKCYDVAHYQDKRQFYIDRAKRQKANDPGLSARQELRRRERAAGRYRPSVCEIPGCGGTTKISFDHCHRSGKFRGWICNDCNNALGRVGDRSTVLRALANYLDAHDNSDI